jgi:homoserine kinase
MRIVRAFAPASIGNVAVGFDTLGAALRPLDGSPFGDIVEVSEAASPSFHCEGPFAHQLPPDPRANLATAACAAYARALGRPLPALRLQLTKGLPVGSGLGSSSATVVAVIRALDALFGHPLEDAALLRAAGEAEARASGSVHLDNVAPALLGGLRLIAPQGDAHALPFPDALRFVVASPSLQLETRIARAVLPAMLPFSQALAHAQNLAAFIHALHHEDHRLLRACFRDLLIEPHRAPLVAGFRSVQSAAMEAGAWACSLSGAGPAVFAVAEAERSAAVASAMGRAWEALGIASVVRTCGLDHEGARVLEEAA